ncbi:MAG: MarR family transcriptional regulator [Gaiellales bacterium]
MASPRPEEYQRAAELRAALRRFLRVSEQVARRHRLTPQRYLLLLMIKGSPGGAERSTVTELASRMQLAQSTVTELVHRAEGVGLIRREPSPRDARVAFLRLTPEAEARLAGAIHDLGPEQLRLAEVLADAHGATP